MNNRAIKEYLKELEDLGLVSDYDLKGTEEIVPMQLTYNSKDVIRDTIFVCKGVAFKEQYLIEACDKGAMLYVSERKYDSVVVPYIIVKDVRRAMPYLASLFFDYSFKNIKSTSITGTKGKTTTAYYLKAITDDYLASIGAKESAILSSIDVIDGVANGKAVNSTPEAIELQRHFNNAVNSGMEYLQMEASSQALKYNRLDCMRFNVGVFLNISEDHISPVEHPNFEDYFESKLRLFEYVDVACVNANSDYAERIRTKAEDAAGIKRVISFGTKAGSDVYGYGIEKVEEGILFRVKTDKFDEPFMITMPGIFNVENALAAISVAYVYGIPVEYIKSGLYRARSSGRMELFESNDKRMVAIVDFAHNKLSFEKIFESTMMDYPEYNIVAIFGCPGDKALSRRKDMGTLAGKYADKVYIVADDPGHEEVSDISAEIEKYIKEYECDYEIIEDRGEAIAKAMKEAALKTVFLILGKGNDETIKYGDKNIPCKSDVELAKINIEEYNKRVGTEHRCKEE